MKLNDLVVLSEKAIKRFYGRAARIEDFTVDRNPENLTSEQFIEFVDSYLGFENGKTIGVIGSIQNDIAKVIFYCPVKDRLDYKYYFFEDLKKLKVRIV
jgi:hypothetical protein